MPSSPLPTYPIPKHPHAFELGSPSPPASLKQKLCTEARRKHSAPPAIRLCDAYTPSPPGTRLRSQNMLLILNYASSAWTYAWPCGLNSSACNSPSALLRSASASTSATSSSLSLRTNLGGGKQGITQMARAFGRRQDKSTAVWRGIRLPQVVDHGLRIRSEK